MMTIKQREIDYRYTKNPCKNHNLKRIVKKNGDIIGMICKKCGREFLASSKDIPIGVFYNHFGGVVVMGGRIEIYLKKKK